MASVRQYRRTGRVTDRLLGRLAGAIPALADDARLELYALCGTPWPARDDLLHSDELATIVDLVFDRRGHRLARPARRAGRAKVRTPRDTMVRRALAEP